MTFDEAIKEINEAYDLIEYADMANTIDEVVVKLQAEYAPTIEMTKEQYNIFNADMQLNQKALDDYIDESMGLPKITNRQMLNLYIHPETIKVIDTEIN